jgi:hypothetical protein
MGRKRKEDADRDVEPRPEGTKASPVIFVQHNPVPPEPTPDIDKGVPGGRFVVNGVTVDAHGKRIPEGQEAQDPATFAREVAQSEDLSKLADPAFDEPDEPENAENVATIQPPPGAEPDDNR